MRVVSTGTYGRPRWKRVNRFLTVLALNVGEVVEDLKRLLWLNINLFQLFYLYFKLLSNKEESDTCSAIYGMMIS